MRDTTEKSNGGFGRRGILPRLALCFLLVLSDTPASALTVPEKLVYSVSWTLLHAGSAVQEITPQGDDLRIVNTVRSSGMVSSIFSVDDRTESVIYHKSGAPFFGLPYFYQERINEGKTHSRKEARFDFAHLKVRVKDLLGKTEKTDPISPQTYDSLSSIYYIRSRELVPGQTILFDIYDFKHLWRTEVKVVKREEISTPLGKFKTIKVTSALSFNGVPARVGNGTVWLTDDSRRIPVKIVTELKVGELTMTLVGGSYRH